MKKDIIDMVIKYGEFRALWLSAVMSDKSTRLRTKRLDQLTEGYFDKILKATRDIRLKEVQK